MMQEFMKNNYKIVEFDEMADVYIVNTCTVTNIADKKSRQMLRKVKDMNPNSILIAVGCYAQVAKQDLEKIPEIDLILGVNEKKDIFKYIKEWKEGDTEAFISDVIHQTEFVDFGSVTYTEKTRAVIKVQDGCDRYCSYCIIPYARGRVRSRKPESVLKEIKSIADKEYGSLDIYGKVMSENDLNVYNTNLSFDLKKNELIYTECNCVDFENNCDFNSTYICKHIGATFYKFQEEVKERSNNKSKKYIRKINNRCTCI